MGVLFEVLKGVFYVYSVIIALFYLRGQSIISNQVTFDMSIKIMIPAYLILAGIMVGYIIYQIYIVSRKDELADENFKKNLLIKFFLAGSLIGAIMAVVYIFSI